VPAYTLGLTPAGDPHGGNSILVPAGERNSRSIPRFQVYVQPLFLGWFGALRILFEHAPSVHELRTVRLARSLAKNATGSSKRALSASALLHIGIGLFLLRMPFGLLFPEHRPLVVWPRAASLTYHLTSVSLPLRLPRVQPAGPGGAPGRGIHSDKLPALGSIAFHPRITIISNPPRPDNRRQTIVQPNTPPDLRITEEFKLPNILTGSLQPLQKPRLEVKLSAPHASARTDSAAVQAPQIAAVPKEMTVPLLEATVSAPRLPMPVASSLAAPQAPNRSASGNGFAEQASADAAGSGLLILSIDPASTGSIVSLPLGNRYGAFSISPGGGLPGSPGGVQGGDPQGGTGGPGNGGDASVGVGGGNNGGGGNGAGGIPVSITGSAGVGGGMSHGLLNAPSPASLVYAVTLPKLRKPSMLVFTGPIGGGGLGIYGVLRCGKIYTSYLPMPGKRWVLEYCAAGALAEKATQNGGTILALGDPGLVGPEADEQFDFHRPLVPPEKADKLIVLHGVIQADGTVGALQVLQGVGADADLAARAAFGKWKFKPALRNAKPISVEVLVGIPAVVPETH
jgi:hypothetical protein